MLITIQFMHADILTEFIVPHALYRFLHFFLSFFLSIFFLILTSFYASVISVEGYCCT